jgi:hypothetical protein
LRPQTESSASGRTLYHTFQPNTAGPVHLCHAENTAIFQYYNIKQHRHEITALELYEPELDWKGYMSQQLHFFTDYFLVHSTPFSSFNSSTPVVRSQSYVIHSGVQYIATTNTARGITTKFFLCMFAL